MRKIIFVLTATYCFFLLSGSAYGLGEKTFTLGGGSWEFVETRRGVTEVSGIRPHPVLALAGLNDVIAGEKAENADESSVDLYLSFDEETAAGFSDSRGCYALSVPPGLERAASPWSRIGTGAALFFGAGRTGNDTLVLAPRGNAMLAPGSHVRDFSIGFWLYPQSVETGERILAWTSSKEDGKGDYINQRIVCTAAGNRLTWTFTDFFFSPGGMERKTVTLTGSPVLSRKWSHHLIRFDADTGLLEYLVDGRVEALDYTTSTGREGGEVFTPLTGTDCRLSLGGRFSGMMDEFTIYRIYLENAALEKYPSRGGRAESCAIDLGHRGSRLLKVEAYGGRTSNNSGKTRNEYAGNSGFSFSDHGAMNFFVRASDSPYSWNDIPWVPVNPGTELPEALRGRYIQVATDFYPGEDGESSPYLAELKLIYNPAEPPPPPAWLNAAAKDGAVELTWRESPSREAEGYLVYYGTAKGEYFGDHAATGTGENSRVLVSPVDAGNRTSIRLEGLRNGTLYYFAVAAYSKPETGSVTPLPVYGLPALEPGEFSREAAARPLRKVE